MKLRIYLISLIFLFIFLPVLTFAQEQITITTYYPSPYGSYQELEVHGNFYINAYRQNLGNVDDYSNSFVFYDREGHDYFRIYRHQPSTGNNACGTQWGCLVFDAVDRGASPANADILFGATDRDGFNPYLIIKGTDGNVGIGTTNPQERLEVDGTIRASGFKTSGRYLRIYHD